MKNQIGSLSLSTHVRTDGQNSKVSLSSYTLNKKVVAMFDRLTTTDVQGESKLFDNVPTDAQVRN